MTDHQLLIAAARAVYGATWDPLTDQVPNDVWAPLDDDGDALRLAVKLRMCVETWGYGAASVVIVNGRALIVEPHYGDEPERATRRAIVRAAAQIGGAK